MIGIGRKKPANEPADLAAAQATPGTSTSTGGATATRNSGAATGGVVTVTISGSSVGVLCGAVGARSVIGSWRSITLKMYWFVVVVGYGKVKQRGKIKWQTK